MSLDGGPRSASVITLEATTCVVVTRQTLREHIAAHPEFAFELLARVIRRARLATQTARNMALLDVYGRVVHLLESLAEPQADGSPPVARRLTHKEIASRVGASREMVSRLMKDLRDGGYIEVDTDRVIAAAPAAGALVNLSRCPGSAAPKRCVGFSARAYSGLTFGRLTSMSRMRVGPDGWVLMNCGGAPLLACAIFCHSVMPACRVVAGARGEVDADQVGLGLVLAAELERQQLAAHVEQRVAGVAQAEQRRQQAGADLRRRALAHLLARVFAQRVGGLVAHDHRDLVVIELELVEDAVVEGDLAARHAEGVDLLARRSG